MFYFAGDKLLSATISYAQESDKRAKHKNEEYIKQLEEKVC